jgi:hypothetical protein
MKLLGANEENSDSSNNRPQIRTSQDDAAVGYGFHQENEFPAFAQKRWAGTDDAIDVNIFSMFIFHLFITNPRASSFSLRTFVVFDIIYKRKERKIINSFFPSYTRSTHT